MTIDQDLRRWFYDGGWIPWRYSRSLPPDVMAKWRQKFYMRPEMCLIVNQAWSTPCTRPAGHLGRHHAGDGLIIYAVWS